jgi:hypothetical protein
MEMNNENRLRELMMMVGSSILAGLIIYCVIMFRDLPRKYFLFVGPLFFIKTHSGVAILTGCFFGTLLLRLIVKKIFKLYKVHKEAHSYFYPIFDDQGQLQFERISSRKYQKSLITNKKTQPVAGECNKNKELVA